MLTLRAGPSGMQRAIHCSIALMPRALELVRGGRCSGVRLSMDTPTHSRTVSFETVIA